MNRRTNYSSGSLHTFHPDVKNQLTNATPVGKQTYDDNGNLLYAAGSYHGYAYDDENRLVRWYYYGAGYDGEGQPTSSEDWRTDFVYDGLGRLRKRVEYEVGGLEWWVWSETYYIYDGMRVIQERGDATVSYTRGSDLSGTLEGAGGIGGLLARSPGSTHSYYHADGGGNVTYLVNSSQGLAASYKYDAYGNLVSQSGSLAGANVYRFSSKEWLATPGLYYYGYRWYAPNLQRWPNRDPLEERGGLNLYGMVGNDPVDTVDYLGLKKLSKSDGVAALQAGLSMLEAACDKGCKKRFLGIFKRTCCTPRVCKKEAKQIIQSLIEAWERNYGNGPYDDSAPGSDTVGGYFCWDWSHIFENALANFKPDCVSFEQGMAAAPATAQGTPVHWYLMVHACKKEKAETRVNFDDGIFDGQNTCHPGTFPDPTSPYQPTPPIVTPTWPPYVPIKPAPPRVR